MFHDFFTEQIDFENILWTFQKRKDIMQAGAHFGESADNRKRRAIGLSKRQPIAPLKKQGADFAAILQKRELTRGLTGRCTGDILA